MNEGIRISEHMEGLTLDRSKDSSAILEEIRGEHRLRCWEICNSEVSVHGFSQQCSVKWEQGHRLRMSTEEMLKFEEEEKDTLQNASLSGLGENSGFVVQHKRAT